MLIERAHVCRQIEFNIFHRNRMEASKVATGEFIIRFHWNWTLKCNFKWLQI